MLKTGGSVKIKRILVYGPIGSGKSSVLKLFKEWGAFTIDCDHITHQILEHDPEVLPILTEYFGSFILEKGKISRKKLSSAAFASKKNLLATSETQWTPLGESIVLCSQRSAHPKLPRCLAQHMSEFTSSLSQRT